MTASSAITIRLEPHHCNLYTTYFVCGECERTSCLTIAPEGDGTAKLYYHENTARLNLSPCNPFWGVIPQGKHSISCAFCKSAIGELDLSLAPDGTCFSSISCEKDGSKQPPLEVFP
jgi:hypothetical protein